MPDYYPILTREQVQGKQLSFRRGSGAANFHDPKQPRNYAWHEQFVINPLIQAGHVSDGSKTPFDDRKLRYDCTEISGDQIIISLGITHFWAYKAELGYQGIEREVLKTAGRIRFEDEFAFFSRPLALTVLPITQEGTAFIGERGNKERGGLWNAVAGYVRFSPPEKVNLEEDLYRELQEEFGISRDDVLLSPTLVGISCSSSTGEAEPSYVVKTKVPEEYFTSGRWKERVKEREYKRLARISSLAERDQLIKQGRLPGIEGKVELMHATEHVFRNLRAEDLTRLE